MQILGTKTGLKILKVVFENPLKEFKEIDLIKEAGTGKGSASDIINKLIKEKILIEKKVGKAKIVSLNMRNHSAFLIKELFDRTKLLVMGKNKLAALMLFSKEIKEFSDLVVVFGSSIAGTSTKESDIDVLIACNNPNKLQESRKKIEELFNLRFNIHSYDRKINNDLFVQNALLTGSLIYGFDLGKEIFSNMAGRDDLDKLYFFIQRIKSAGRNYNHKDYESAEAIMESLIDQIILYILSDRKINYVSKKDARGSIKKTPEGKLIEKILKSRIKSKIILTEKLVISVLTCKILKDEGY